MSKPRTLSSIYDGMPTSDGAGVELTRVIGQPQLNQLDPFLLLDDFRSDQPEDYIAGFPAHPHRGFETVTYLIAGRVRHRDSAGHEGVIEPGGVQWMTAGRGIVHSEMPEQQDGLLEGLQLWVNLPATHKMVTPAYAEHSAEQIPSEQRAPGVEVKVVAGTTSTGVVGAVQQPLTEPLYLDVDLQAGARFTESLPAAHNAFVYVLEGTLSVDEGTGEHLEKRQLGILSAGDHVTLSTSTGARFVLVAGRPLNEPVARGGPFVMNTEAEVRQAFADFHDGNLA